VVAVDRDVVVVSPVVEARLELQAVGHRAAHRHDPAHELLLGATDGHEVLDLAHPRGRQEPGDEQIRVGKVQILPLDAGRDR
jgi:hypothetical protein